MTGAANAGTIDPRGVYFHRFTGPSSGAEWIHIWGIEGDNRYRFSDVRGFAPYDGEILSNGQITWDTGGGQSGSGMFTSQNEATQTLVYFGGNYASTLRRAPGTDASFITRIDSRTNGDASIAGGWDLQIKELDPETGEVLSESTMGATASVTDDRLRLTYDDGTYFQGVFEEDDHAGFRVVLPNGGLVPEFRSFAGSETSLTMNLLGDFRMTGEDSFNATFLTQSRTTPGSHTMGVYVITGTRAVPAPGGVGVLGVATVLVARRRRGR